MREIKFRGYDEDSKCWRYGSYFCKEDVTLSPIYNNKEQYEKDKKENEHHLILINGFSDWNLPRPHYQSEVVRETVGQYTGLRDKNGKEIYEGDILKGFKYPFLLDGNHNYFAEVCWFDNAKYFGIYTIKNPTSNVRGISEGNIENLEDWDREQWEVIGNIYENPELLEVKNEMQRM